MKVFRSPGLILVLGLALAARLAALALLGAGLQRDPDGYWELAASLARRHVFGYEASSAEGGARFPLTAERAGAPLRDDESPSRLVPTAFRPPLYPLILVALTGGERLTERVAAFQIVCGLATVWLTWRMSLALGLAPINSLFAAALVAIDPILLAQTAQVMTECVAALLAAAALLALIAAERAPAPWKMALAGAIGGAAALCRPTFLLWLLLVGAALAWRTIRPAHESTCQPAAPRPIARRQRALRLAAFASGAIVVLSPWAIRNAIVFGRPIVTTTHGGYTLLLGNNRDYYGYLRDHFWGGAWRADKLQDELEREMAARGARDELARDRVAKDLALEAIRAQPALFVAASVKRCSRLWGCLPERLAGDEPSARRWARYGTAAALASELLLAMTGAWRLGGKPGRSRWLGALLMVLAFTATHAVFWTDLRMRAPLAPIVAALAASAIPPAGRRSARKPK